MRGPRRAVGIAQLTGPVLRDGAGGGMIAFPKSNRPDGPGADERNGDGVLTRAERHRRLRWRSCWPTRMRQPRRLGDSIRPTHSIDAGAYA